MKTRHYQYSDYSEAKQWWLANDGYALPQEALPETGAVCYDGDSSVAMAWLYLDVTTKVCFMAWINANPERSKKKRIAAIRKLVEALTTQAKSLNYNICIANTSNAVIHRLFEQSGFTESETLKQSIKTL